MAGGQQITSGQGSVTQSESLVLTGIAVSVGAGTIVANSPADVAMTGSSASASAGSLASGPIVLLRSRKVGAGSASRALSGISMTSSRGDVSFGKGFALSGAQSSLLSGTMTHGRSVQQTGVPLSAVSGFVSGPSSGQTITSFSVVSTVGGANVPFTVGMPFKQGDIPSGQTLSTLQCNIKNTWPDGSAKFAVLTGFISLTANVSRTINCQIGSAPGGSSLTTTDLKTQLTQPVTIDAGAFGSASWSGTNWDTPFQTWASGPLMSSWVYRKQIGSDAHLVAWLEVRLWSSGAVEILPWVENGYLTVASPTSKSATYTFTMGGTQRFSAAIDIPNHCRTPLVSGSALSHWLSSDPDVIVKHDAAYMMSTEQVPTYSASVSAGSALVTGLPSSYTPLQLGSYPGTMGSAGYHGSIGLLPQWDVLYLTSTASSVWAALQRNAYSAGRYSIHHRDETTNRPLRFSSYPTLLVDSNNSTNWINIGSSSTGSYTPQATGTTPAGWAATHHPSVGYMAYLVTGRFYHMETVQLAATAVYLNASSAPRENASSIFQTWAGITSRQAAWSLRTLAQAANATPDADTPLKTEFQTAIDANINRQHATHVAQSNNLFGFMQNDVDFTDNGSFGTNRYVVRTWMHDFYTAAFGWLTTLQLGSTSAVRAKASDFFAWTSRRIVGRLGTAAATDYLYRDAATYNNSQNPSDSPTYTNGSGPWYSDWGTCYTATMDHEYLGSPPVKEIGDGSLRGAASGLQGYWGNLQPALSYAVRHVTPGADQGRARMTGASNWATVDATGSSFPEWSVAPASSNRGISSIAQAAATLSAGGWVRVAAADISSPSSYFDDPGTTYLSSYTHKMEYDPISKKVMFVGLGHHGVGDTPEQLLQFDETTNVWSKGAISVGSTGIAHGFAHGSIDPSSGEMYYRRYNAPSGGGQFFRRGFDGVWTAFNVTATVSQSGGWGGIEWFPGFGKLGGLVMAMGDGIHVWDKATGAWSRLANFGSAINSQFSILSQRDNVVYCSKGNASAEWNVVNQYGTVTSIGNCPAGAIGHTAGIAWCCQVTGDLIVASSSSNAARYRPGTGWASISLSGGPNFGALAPGQGDGANNGLFADIPQYGVVLYVNPEGANAGQVWLYKYA